MLFRILFIIFFCCLTKVVNSQTKISGGGISGNGNGQEKDSTLLNRSNGFNKVASIDMYLIYNDKVDSVQVDTTLSIAKEYKFNYLQRDNFGLMQFANFGQTYNSLFYNVNENSSVPKLGARARHFNYFEHEDIKYYEVPTPWTRLTYKTAVEQGQMLDAFFTVNLSRQLNFSLAYKGLRSLGNYQNALTSSGNFRFTSNYNSKNKRYKARGYVVAQDLLNQENGGIKNDDLENFTSGDKEFLDRSVFDPNFEDAENTLKGNRYYFEQSYNIIRSADSISKQSVHVFNKLSFENKSYQYSQTTAASDYFGDAFNTSINDKVKLQNFKTSLGLNYSNKTIGDVMFAFNYNKINYGYNSVVLLLDENIPNRINTNFLGLETAYSKTFNKLKLSGSAGLNISDEFLGSYIDGSIGLSINNDFNFIGGISISSRLANYNYLLYQSDYVNYNWYNLESYSNVNSQQIKFGVYSKKYLNAILEISNIDNYTFFNLEDSSDDINIIRPKQYNEPIKYLKLKLEKEFKVGNFALDNTIMYQNVVSDEDVLNVPTFITRNTLYYSNQLFKKSMTFQTGVIFNYFTKYNMNGYDPLLAEFYTQNETEIGGFPRLDFFINAKVRQTRIYLKAEHFNSSFTGYNYFSAPNHPYRDFIVRFGLVWDFFL
ncbi:putative porin [Winogradskyella eckloniae]|uniref:putative porin n=1 Tax=Winogradskyella eckloniae TaxID=1089306 RepID=UPI0015645C49|nr:putative porin [Winogradskyella eckloniae]NRD19460.1 putative porin [Winogradskyella eckloniae]